MTKADLANMADFIAQAIHAKAADGTDETWATLSEDERNEFRIIAHAAMGAHDAWLTVQGYKILKPPAKKKPAIQRPGLVDSRGRAIAGKA